MDRRLVMAASFGVLVAGCVRPEMRSSHAPFSPPRQSGQVVALAPSTRAAEPQPGQDLGPAVTINSPGVISDVPPSEMGVTIGRSIAGQVKQVRISSTPAQFTKAAPTWSMAGPVEVRSDGDGVARLTGPEVTRAYTQLPRGYSLLKAEALDADGKVVAASQKLVVNVGNVVSRSETQVRAAGVPLLAQRQPYRAAAWLRAAAAIDRLKTAIAQEQVDDVGRLVHEVQTRISMLQWDHQPDVDRTYLHDLLVLGYYPEAQVIVEYPAADTASVVFNGGAAALANVVVQQFASEEAARAEMGRQLADVPTAQVEQYRGKSKCSTLWTKSEPVEASTLDLHDDLLILDAQARDMVYVVSPEVLLSQRVDAVVITPRAHSQPAKVATVCAAGRSLPRVTLDDLAGAKRVLVAGDVRNDARFAKARYARVSVCEGAAQLYVVDGTRLLKAVAPSVDAAVLAVQMVQSGRPVREMEMDWLRREVVRGGAASECGQGAQCQ